MVICLIAAGKLFHTRGPRRQNFCRRDLSVYEIVCLSVCLLVAAVSNAKAAGPIEKPSDVWTRGPVEQCVG